MGNSISEDPEWYWLDKNKEWILLTEEDSKNIENEYQQYHKTGKLIYHCFGNGYPARVNFFAMETYCALPDCRICEIQRNYSHMSFRLKREIPDREVAESWMIT